MPKLKYHVENDFAVGTFDNGERMIFDIADLDAISKKVGLLIPSAIHLRLSIEKTLDCTFSY